MIRQNIFLEKMKTKKISKTTNSTFGERLTRIRKQRGLTQEELGKMIGVSQRVIAYYEKETQYPPAGKFNQLIKILRVSANELLGISPLTTDVPVNRRLAKRFHLLEKMPEQDQKAVIHYIDALLLKRQFSKITKEGKINGNDDKYARESL